MSSNKPPELNYVTTSPFFDQQGHWAGGYAFAKGEGPGVVVGPGLQNPNLLTQSFSIERGQQFKIVAQASSAGSPNAVGHVQVNWFDKDDRFITVSQSDFPVGRPVTTFEYPIVAPAGAVKGVMYVIPGGTGAAVRYIEMGVTPLDPIADFLSYRFFGVEGQILAGVGAISVIFAVLYCVFRNRLFAFGALFIRNIIVRYFPLFALVTIAGMFVVMEHIYEQNYDAHWTQGSIEAVLRWGRLSLSLGGNPLYNFGIQHVVNPMLSPTFLLGSLVPAEYRIQAEAAFQATIIFVVLVQICRLAGARLLDASAIGLIATLYLWVPLLSDEAITLNASLNLRWQEGMIATLFIFVCFSGIGYSKFKRATQALLAVSLAAVIVWFCLAFPEVVPFFTFAAAGLCLGALIGSESKREVLDKILVSVTIIAILFALGLPNYLLNLFLYTPQAFYKTITREGFVDSLLLSSNIVGGRKVVIFYVLASLGAIFALGFGDKFARRVVLAAGTMELLVYSLCVLNARFNLVPIHPTYIELMGLSIVALLAGAGLWGLLLIISYYIGKTVAFMQRGGLKQRWTLLQMQAERADPL